MVKFYTAWEVHTTGTRALFQAHGPDEAVWTSPCGGYAVGDILEMQDFDEVGELYIEAGCVDDYLHDDDDDYVLTYPQIHVIMENDREGDGKMNWEINWDCWCGEVDAIAHESGFRVNAPIISVTDVFGTSVVLDTPQNRAALEKAAATGTGKNGLRWSGRLRATVPAHKTVRHP